MDGSLLKRVFCFTAHEQCDLMLYFSLSMCIAFTKSVRTKTQTKQISQRSTLSLLPAKGLTTSNLGSHESESISFRTSSWNDLCWHQVLVIMRLSLDTLQPGVKLFICGIRKGGLLTETESNNTHREGRCHWPNFP